MSDSAASLVIVSHEAILTRDAPKFPTQLARDDLGLKAAERLAQLVIKTKPMRHCHPPPVIRGINWFQNVTRHTATRAFKIHLKGLNPGLAFALVRKKQSSYGIENP